MQSKVDKIIPSDSNSSVASAVVVTSEAGQSTTLQADIIVMGVGVAPATEYLKSSKGFEQAVDKSGAVTVDEYLKVKGLDNVYAIGDIAMYPQPGTGEMRRIEHWNVSFLHSNTFSNWIDVVPGGWQPRSRGGQDDRRGKGPTFREGSCLLECTCVLLFVVCP